MCSTPRGITGKIAGGWLSSRADQGSAQRLAASQEKSLRARLIVGSWPAVLTASRHTRKNSLYAFSDIPATFSVPNPSRHHRKNRRARLTCRFAVGGAQRLAASQEKSHEAANIFP